MCFHTNCETFVIGSLVGPSLNLQIALGRIVIFTVLLLPVQEHGVSLHRSMLSVVSFISVLQFSVYRSFISLVRFIPRYITLFVAMVDETVSLISVSDFSLLVNRNARGFCVLCDFTIFFD